jgi:uncharacterized protein (DUF1697 family)
MADIPHLFESLGHADVTTYLQSGNVFFTSGADEEPTRRALEIELAERLGFTIDVVLRRASELAAAIARNPFPGAAAEPTTLHVAFLVAAPTGEAVAAVEPDRSPPDRFEVRGREIFLNYPHGSGRSKLTLDWLERQLAVRGTARNWNTVTAIADRL